MDENSRISKRRPALIIDSINKLRDWIEGQEKRAPNAKYFYPLIKQYCGTDWKVNMDKVNAEQCRRILDRLIGYTISPVMWKVLKGQNLSAGRCQSPITRLIHERCSQIEEFYAGAASYNFQVTGDFTIKQIGKSIDVSTKLNKTFDDEKKLAKFLSYCKGAEFEVKMLSMTEKKQNPSPPFETSSMLSTISNKLGWSIKQITALAQRLFTDGHITYIRTDSTAIDPSAIPGIHKRIGELYEATDVNKNIKHKKIKKKNEQHGHECIRPTKLTLSPRVIQDEKARRLYQEIWKRTMASQMKPRIFDQHTIHIGFVDPKKKWEKYEFQLSYDITKYEGFMKVYQNPNDPKVQEETKMNALYQQIAKGDEVDYRTILANQKFKAAPAYFSESSLISQLKKLGIGRPATYKSLFDTIQNREYVEKGSLPARTREAIQLKLDSGDGEVVRIVRKEKFGAVKNKLLITQKGVQVSKYLCKEFVNIMDYDYTSKLEDELNEINAGNKVWTNVVGEFYEDFNNLVVEIRKKMRENPDGYKRNLGEHEGKVVFAYHARYGPCVQWGKGSGSGKKRIKPFYASIEKPLEWEFITLEEAVGLIKKKQEGGDEKKAEAEPAGEFEGRAIFMKKGPYGPYVQLAPLSEGEKPENITWKDKSVDIEEITFEMMVARIQEFRREQLGEWRGYKIFVKKHKTRGGFIQVNVPQGRRKVAFESLPKGKTFDTITREEVIAHLEKSKKIMGLIESQQSKKPVAKKKTTKAKSKAKPKATKKKTKTKKK